MNLKRQLENRVKSLERDLASWDSTEVLERWPYLRGEQLKMQLEIRIAEIKYQLAQFDEMSSYRQDG